MNGLIIGLDLCDEYTEVSCAAHEKTWTVPTVICRNKNKEEWYVGEAAYANVLEGRGVIVDKLLKQVMKDGTATIGGTKYEAVFILKQFLKNIIDNVCTELNADKVSGLVITLQSIEGKLLDILMHCADYLEIARENVHIISHAESFIYYTLSQKKEMWNSNVGVFELSDERLCYYELKVQRGMRQTTVIAEYENLEEGFNIDILNTASGKKLADKILCSCGERLLQKKLFSAVFLTGKGFASQDWAVEFMQLICKKRRVYVESSLFAKGAAFKAADYAQEKTSYPYVCICEGRLNASVSVPIVHKERESLLVIAAAGDNWYESKSSMEFILDNQDYVEFIITPLDVRKKKSVKIMLENFPERPDKTTRIRVNAGFLDDKTMAVSIEDMGFGELFPRSDALIRQEVML